MVKEQKVVLRPRTVKGVFTGIIDLMTPAAIEKHAKGTDKRRMVITRDGTLIYQKMTDPIPNIEKFFVNFKQRNEWEWKWKEDGSPSTKNIKAIVEAIGLHPKVEVKYGEKNPNQMGEADFYLEYQSNQTIQDAKILVKKHKAMEKWMGLTVEQKINCAYSYGVNASKYSSISAIFNVMADYTSGIIMSANPRDPKDKKSKSFIDDFLQYEATSQTKILEALTEKAIINKVFPKRDAGYFYEEQYVGGEKGDVMAFLSNNPSIFNFIQESVRSNEIEDDMDEKATDSPSKETLERAAKLKIPDAKNYTEASLADQCNFYDAMRNRAREMGFSKWNVANINTLKEFVAEKVKENNQE